MGSRAVPAQAQMFMERPSCTPPPARHISVVIAGGGVQCAAGLGLVQVLARERLPIHLLMGCSGGALFAALLSLGLPSAQVMAWIPKLWTHHLTRHRNERAALLAMLHQHKRPDDTQGLVPADPARQHALALQQVFGDTRMEDTAIPLVITAADAQSGAQAIFTRGRLRDVILTSHARPFEIAAWMHDGSLYNNGFLPPSPTRAGDIVLCLDFAGDVDAVDDPSDIDDAASAEQPQHPSQAEQYLRNLLGKSLYNQRHDAAPRPLSQLPYALQQAVDKGTVIAVLPKFAQPVGRFDYAKIPSIVAQGERAAQAILPQLYAQLHAPCTQAPMAHQRDNPVRQESLSDLQ